MEEHLEPKPDRRDRPKTVILRALGGQGKSQLGLEYCRRYQDHIRGMFWIDATNKSSAERDLERIADQLNEGLGRVLKNTKDRLMFMKERLRDWEGRWLLVFDNYDQPESFDVTEFFPTSEFSRPIYVAQR